MKFKKLISAALGLMAFSSVMSAQNDAPSWMRYCAISPDGTTIAFTYKGDIYTVPVEGGLARQITTNPAYDSNPVWSPDGSRIAFSSNRMGSNDVFIVSKDGGTAVRLTTHSGGERPIAFKDNNTLLFSAFIMPDAESMQFPSSQFYQIYSVNTQGGRPQMFSSLPLEDICFSQDGKYFLYHDKKGYEDNWRKHHTSSITRDIWQCSLKGDDVKDASFLKLTGFEGEDRNPVLVNNDKGFYYLSEKSGSFNIWYRDLNGDNEKQITEYKSHPVRFLSASDKGDLCFGYDGEIYTIVNGNQPRKVNVRIVADDLNKEVTNWNVRNVGRDMAVSKDGKQIAFTFRGDVYVTSDKYATTKRITNTAAQERDLDFAPDGRSLIYSSERDGVWQVYRASIVNEDEKFFTYATEIKEENLINSDEASFQPQFSPDGKEVAFLANRTEIRVLNLDTKKVRTVMEAKYQYSYVDGDQWFQWSPDGKWILSNCIFDGGWNNTDVALIPASGKGEMINLTNSGYSDSSPKWVLGGKAMIWASDRAGYRSHGSWGAESDAYIMFFDLEEYEKFRMNEEELGLYTEAKKAKEEADKKAKEEADKKNKKKDKKGKKDEEKADAKQEEIVLDIENAKYRVFRLTNHSSHLVDGVLNKEGDKFYYLCSFEGQPDLWVRDLKKGDTKILVKGAGSSGLVMNESANAIFMVQYGSPVKVDLASGAVTPIAINGSFEYKPAQEREYIFNHAWKQVLDKFYVEDLHGVDWDFYKKEYSKYLPHINNNADFAEMLSEMLGELNASHTGARSYSSSNVEPTASLGVFYDDTYDGDGLKIKEILKRGPLAVIKSDVKTGAIIKAIDGEKIVKGMDYYPLLAGKVGKKIRLTIENPDKKGEFVVEVKGISQGAEGSLLYSRWVERNQKIVEEASNGRIGYVHIEGMDSPSFREIYSDILGKFRHADAIVVDTRHNGGGWLHEDVISLLTGELYAQFKPRGQYIGDDPFNRWYKPSCMLICEDNYSNAHGTPWAYKELGIGKLVGAPVPGTMTAVWWEYQIDGSTVFGIPQVGCMDMKGRYLENLQLEPDVEIYNPNEEVLNGHDSQLLKAVEVLQKDADEFFKAHPEIKRK